MEGLFSEYLIEQNIINQDQLLEAFIAQLNSIPSLPELLYDLNLISKKDLLRILLHQMYEKQDFQSSAIKLGLWSADISDEIQNKIQNMVKPLGEILIQKGFVNAAVLTSTFATYVEQKNISKINENAVKNTVISEKKIEVPEKSTEKSSPSPPTASKLNSSLIKEYISCIEENISPNLTNILAKLKSDGLTEDKIKKDIQSVLSELVAARAAADFLGAKLSLNIANKTIVTLESFINSKSILTLAQIIEVIECSLNILNVYAKMIKNLNIENDEDPETKKYVDHFNNIISKKE
ncbi:hypothetical protein [Silvanigrella aquatica]|uniref:Uncharacterized protein n=1 Tax=Silvanigrella aquatica TaxID=1915309 RepID=A0A1L4CYV1_9BACT|nr:hypothetical protein [Silvanigrella aquatica]APJ03134.1 hypothetical protein AXG55_04120 [Silvanigrella aquatica]